MAPNDITPSVNRPTDLFNVMRNEFDRIFDRFETGWPRLPNRLGSGIDHGMIVPQLDVRDDGQQLTIEAELPGVDDKDVSVTLANGILTIKGEKKTSREDKSEKTYLLERSWGVFERSVRLPESIDDASVAAHFDKGVLKIVARKRPEAIKAEKRIEITKG